MTDLEWRAVRSLMEVTFGKNRSAMGFVSRLYMAMVSDPLWPLTPNDAARLWATCWTYRRQYADAAVKAHADEVVNGALALRF